MKWLLSGRWMGRTSADSVKPRAAWLRLRGRQAREQAGLSLVEVVLGAVILAIVVAAILGAYMGQVTLNEHARNLSFAVNDAGRVMEEIRSENVGCVSPNFPDIDPQLRGVGDPDDWDEWMNTGKPGAPKSIGLDPQTGANRDDTQERIFVTCLRPGVSDYCGDQNQVGAGEWKTQTGATTSFNPIEVTVAVCWRHRGRVVGECQWNGSALNWNDADSDGVIESPVMLTTLIACHG